LAQLTDNALPVSFYSDCQSIGTRHLLTFLEATDLVTSRGKRWNGNVDSLPVEYLKGVMAKMEDYGDRVQFSLISGGPQPSYQITNEQDKKMAFDRNHHLLQPQEDEFTGVNATAVLTLEQIRAGIALGGLSSGRAKTTRGTAVRASTGATRTTAAKLEDQFASQRYEYFKNNRATLPAAISQYSDEITALMKQGMPVEAAFDEVLKKHF
jgi:hypothetical protein